MHRPGACAGLQLIEHTHATSFGRHCLQRSSPGAQRFISNLLQRQISGTVRHQQEQELAWIENMPSLATLPLSSAAYLMKSDVCMPWEAMSLCSMASRSCATFARSHSVNMGPCSSVLRQCTPHRAASCKPRSDSWRLVRYKRQCITQYNVNLPLSHCMLAINVVSQMQAIALHHIQLKLWSAAAARAGAGECAQATLITEQRWQLNCRCHAHEYA